MGALTTTLHVVGLLVVVTRSEFSVHYFSHIPAVELQPLSGLGIHYFPKGPISRRQYMAWRLWFQCLPFNFSTIDARDSVLVYAFFHLEIRIESKS